MAKKDISMNSVFQDQMLQNEFDEKGYVIFDLLNENEVNSVVEHINSVELPDHKGYGFNIAMDNEDISLRKNVYNFLTQLMSEKMHKTLVNRKPFSTSYMIKEPGSGLVPAHQDWSYTDEKTDPSIMCWVALENTDVDNGAMGFIPGSHHFFDYKRVFPFPYAKTPVELHKLPLMPYLKIEPMKAGQIVFFNNKTIHGSFPNFTQSRRLAFCMSFRVSNKPIHHYQFFDRNNLTHIGQYHVKEDFFVKYNNAMLVDILEKNDGEFEEYEVIDKQPFQLPKLNWEEWETLLHEHGVEKNTTLQHTLDKFLSQNS